jgi:hypothetical protein
VLNRRAGWRHPAKCSGTENTNKYLKVKISTKALRNERSAELYYCTCEALQFSPAIAIVIAPDFESSGPNSSHF